MARSHLRHTLKDTAGNAVQNARVKLYLLGTTTPVTDAYSAASGGSAVTELISNVQGEVEAWLDNPKQIDVVATDNSGTAYLAGASQTRLTFTDLRETVDVYPPADDLVASMALSAAALADHVANYPHPEVDLLNPVFGYVVGGSNNTAALEAAIAAAPAGATLLLPNDTIVTDAITCTKALQLQGHGRFSTWFQPRTAISTALWTWALPGSPPGGTIRGYYGPKIEGVGFDLSAAPNAVGIDTGTTSGWFEGKDLFFQGGRRHVENKSFNNVYRDIVCFDASDAFFWIDGDTGMEVTLERVKGFRNAAGTTRVGIEIICDNAAGVKGEAKLDNVTLGCGMGAATLQNGWIISAPSNVSLPITANKCTNDNVSGPGVTLTNIIDFHWDAGGWINSAAGGPCFRISGGGNIHVLNSKGLFGGGSPTKTFDFVGGSTGMFVSENNYTPTNTIYYMPASGKPVGPFYINDRSPQGAVTPSTNDLAHLKTIVGFRAGPQRFQDQVTFDAVPRWSEQPNGPNGLATLVGGSVTVNHTGVTANTRVRIQRWSPGGTLGHLFSNPGFNVAGVSFTINSSEAADTSAVFWELAEPV